MPLTKIRTNYLPEIIGVLVLACTATGTAIAETRHEINRETGVQSWELHDQGVAFTLMQITPDQARGFFQARGFARDAAEHYASHCVFMTIVRNEAVRESISYKLADWRFYREHATPEKLKLKDDWMKEWRQRGVKEAALIAFEWSQLPTAQTYETGDWNQGMTTYAMPPGSKFNLKFVWEVNGVKHETILEDAQCASAATGG